MNLPSIFQYAPSAAALLFKQAAAPAGANPSAAPPEVMPPEEPPPHPMVVGLKQMLPIGAGMALGAAAGYGIPAALEHYGHIHPSPAAVALSGAVAGGIGGFAGSLLNQQRDAELARAAEEYQNYRAGRAGDRQRPEVQSP